mmetsp:Transcript_47022/g.56863  ORF Transcript_47022/g.56863 Transcript_47022/m.56863 type:complete len:268 (-) Transcript_47022:233-1036(-)|eukprot:CAMPEP_0172499554 /NCGR_PEP_ID=MMETSP1066-20121228/128221_1 /TAXON_ID=671091 /ORGANISM="Coscinodiscus wailesii, Strain CCMP2513" /LENGTH=267 /DNA_ID=CAMNT_0013273339 /DNA_START=130 /DNA_END=933 /DNA_ORIENTATION=+
MSWLNSITSDISSLTNNITSNITSTIETIHKDMPKSSDELLTALTLNTPELSAQRKALEKAERRKAVLRDSLAELFPWETEREENEVLVEECYNAIMALSTTDKSFKEDVAPRDTFPVLLRDFNLEVHARLIERLIEQDNNLKEMQSQFLCGGEKETRFWRNYFYNCAIARETVGLSLDEIWNRVQENVPEEEKTDSDAPEAVVAAVAQPPAVDKPVAKVAETTKGEKKSDEDNSDSSSPGKDFEMVEESNEDLDELAAEIAKELEE